MLIVCGTLVTTSTPKIQVLYIHTHIRTARTALFHNFNSIFIRKIRYSKPVPCQWLNLVNIEADETNESFAVVCVRVSISL